MLRFMHFMHIRPSESHAMVPASKNRSSVFPEILAVAWPVMLSYVAVGLACGVLADQAGMNGLECFLLSATYLSGSGQFMISNLWLQGTPIASLAISVCAVSSRFALYSASLAPALARFSKRESLAIASTYTEEAYGITLGKLAEGNTWSFRHAFTLDIILLLTWSVSVATGAVIGSAANIPTAVASFAMTGLFIYLLSGQLKDRTSIVVALAAALSVFLAKSAGAAGAAVPIAALVGVAAGLIAAAARRDQA